MWADLSPKNWMASYSFCHQPNGTCFFFDEGNDQIDPAEPAISVMDSLDQNRFRLDS